jgi:arylsulfatase A-like enzyme
MTRRSFAAAGLATLAAAQTGRRPNFIVILLDDLGCMDLGCYGAKDLQTPNIDQLAASGVRFTNWYSNASVCAPARASLMTGRYPAHAGVPTNGGRLSMEQPILPVLLKTAGYKTGLVGKWHLGVRDDAAPNDRGFDQFYGFHSGCVDFYSHRFYWGEPRIANYHDLFRNKTEIWEDGQYLTERISQEAVKFIERHKDEPFFLYAAFNAPHYPMHAPDQYLARFAHLPLERRIYAAMISAVDDGIGAITKTLAQHGLADKTCIVFAGDNGATTERRASLDGLAAATAGINKPYRGSKFSLFDGGMHVPGIVTWPGALPSGEVRDQVVMTMDVLPTICRAAGVSIQAGKKPDGADILSVAKSGSPSPHEAIFWAQGPQLAVRRGPWKLVLNGRTYDGTEDGNKNLTGEDAMFLSDLSQDPGETTNLRRKHAELVDELATLAHKWKAQQAE